LVNSLPGFTGSGLSDAAIDRSAALDTVVVSVSELFPGVGSDVADMVGR